MCPTITVGSFFLDTKGPLFCSFVQQPQTSTTSNLNNSNLRSASKTKRKKTDVHNLEITPRIPHFFSELCDFLKLFGLNIFPQRVPPSIFLMFCNTMDVKKLQRVPPFTFFGTVTLFKNLIKKFYGKFFHVSKGSPLHFLKIFCNQLEFHKARRALDMAPTLAVLGLFLICFHRSSSIFTSLNFY